MSAKKKGGLPETRNYEIFTPKNGWLEEELWVLLGLFGNLAGAMFFSFRGFYPEKKNGFQAREVSPSKRRSRFSRATRRRLSRLRSAPSGRKAAFFLPSLRKHGRKLAKLFNATNCPTPRNGPRPSWLPLKNYTLPDTNSKSP